MATAPRKRAPRTTNTRGTNGARNGTTSVPHWSTEDSLAEFEPREPVFSIDDVDYTMPVVCSASVAIEYVAIARSQGLDAAFEYGCRELLGDDEYQRVIHWPGLKGEHITFLTKVVDDKMVGALGGPKDTTS